jgi:hypothetical protein
MTLDTGDFIRRFLIHVLPKSFHRIRHYGLLANGQRAANIARARNHRITPIRSSCCCNVSICAAGGFGAVVSVAFGEIANWAWTASAAAAPAR